MRGAKLVADREELELEVCRQNLRQRNLSDAELLAFLREAGQASTSDLQEASRQVSEIEQHIDNGAPPSDDPVPAIERYNQSVLVCFAILAELKLRPAGMQQLVLQADEMPVLVASLVAVQSVQTYPDDANKLARRYVNYKSMPATDVDMLAMEVTRNCRMALWYLKYGNFKEYLSATGPERFWETP